MNKCKKKMWVCFKKIKKICLGFDDVMGPLFKRVARSNAEHVHAPQHRKKKKKDAKATLMKLAGFFRMLGFPQ